MVLGEIFERFCEESPVTVMVRATLENVLSPERLDAAGLAAAAGRAVSAHRLVSRPAPPGGAQPGQAGRAS